MTRDVKPKYLLQDCALEPAWERYDTESAQVLGQGSFGCVFAILDKHTKTVEAVKVFKWPLDEEQRDRVVAESKNAQRIPSDLIARTYPPHFGVHASWMAMELVEGQELGAYMAANASLTFPQRLALATTAAEAIDAAHQRSVLHRDIKPSNFIVLNQPPPLMKLTDFGVSKLIDSGTATATGYLHGTPQWAAPELTHGVRTSVASDVYSLGMVAFWLLARAEYPYEIPPGVTPTAELFFKLQREGKPRPLRQLEPAVSEDLDKVISAAIDKHPANRPTARDILNALRAEAAPRPQDISAPRSSPFPVWARAGLGMAAAAVAVGVLVFWSGRSSSQPPTPPTTVANAAAIAGSAPATQETTAPPVTNTPTAAAVTPFAVALDQFGLTIANSSAAVASDVQVVLVGLDGKEFSRSVPRLAPGQAETVFFDSFTPPAPDGSRPARVSIQATTPQGRIDQTIPF